MELFNNEYNIIMDSKKALEKSMEFLSGYVCKGIFEHGKRLAQLEICDCGNGDFLVDISVNSGDYIPKVLKQLERLGFSGCKYSLKKNTWCGPCYAKTSTVFYSII